MRPTSLLGLLVACAGCGVRVPAPPGLTIAVKGQVRVQAQANVQAQAQVEPPPPAPPPPPVAIEGAPVVEFFGIPLDGAQDIVFVLDRSGSMNEAAQGRIAQAQPQAAAEPQPDAAPPTPTPTRKIDVAQRELIDALQRLPAGTQVNVLFFNDQLEAFSATLFPLEEAGRDGVVAYVRETGASGSTALAPAMRTAFLMNARRIVLLSDGLGNVGGNSAAVLRDAREAMRGGVRIDTIGLGKDKDAQLLGTLAAESGGLYQPL